MITIKSNSTAHNGQYWTANSPERVSETVKHWLENALCEGETDKYTITITVNFQDEE